MYHPDYFQELKKKKKPALLKVIYFSRKSASNDWSSQSI